LPFSAVVVVLRDKTSSSTSRDSIGTTRKLAFGNYVKYLSAMQPSNENLGSFSAVIPVWLHKTSSSTSRDSIGSPRKTGLRKLL